MSALGEIRTALKLFSFSRSASPILTCGNKFYATGPSKSKSSTSDTSATSSAPNVTGLSKKVLDMPNSEVGPGASKTSEYKNPEYFCYNAASYFEAEVEMLKYRCPQPSSKASSSK